MQILFYTFALLVSVTSITEARSWYVDGVDSMVVTGAAAHTVIAVNDTAGDGDPQFIWQLTNVTKFALGIDDGDTGLLKWGTTAPGTATWFAYDGTDLFLNGLMVGSLTVSPDGTLHVHTATATGPGGEATANPLAADLVIENDDHVGLSLLSPQGKVSGVYFGVPGDDDAAVIQANYNAGSPKFQVFTGGNLQFTIESDGGIFVPNLLAAAASTDVNINGSSELHSVTSSRRYKINERPLEIDTERIYLIDVVSFTWGQNTGSAGKDDFGPIAEEAYKVFPEIISMAHRRVKAAEVDSITGVSRVIHKPVGVLKPEAFKTQNTIYAMLVELQKLKIRVDLQQTQIDSLTF